MSENPSLADGKPGKQRHGVAASCNLNGNGAKHVLFTDGQTDYQALGGPLLAFDGHCCFSPDEQGLPTDRNHGETLSKSL